MSNNFATFIHALVVGSKSDHSPHSQKIIDNSGMKAIDLFQDHQVLSDSRNGTSIHVFSRREDKPIFTAVIESGSAKYIEFFSNFFSNKLDMG